MSTDSSSINQAAEESQYLQYRSLSMVAVAAFGFFVFSIAALVFPGLLFIPAFGCLLGIMALSSIRRRPLELAGGMLAWIATVGSLVVFIAGTSIAVTIYATEVPDGYQRVGFSELQPDPQRPELPVPPSAIDLDGQRVFVKGYVYPDDRGKSLKQFVLIPDLGTCCFGGQPKLTDMIEVTLDDPLRTQYSYRQHKVAGVLRVDTRIKPISGLEGVYYRLEADYLNGSGATTN